MNWIRALISSKTGMMFTLCLFWGMLLPAQADRRQNDQWHRADWANGKNQKAGKLRYADASSSNRRSPPRNNGAYDDRKRNSNYKDQRGSRKYSGGSARKTPNSSLDDAVSRVRRQSNGRVLSAETVRNNDHEEHRVRVITEDGRVRRYRLNAETGEMLPRKR